MLNNPATKNILSAIAVAVFGFLLLNFTFIFDYLIVTAVTKFIRLFTPVNVEMTYNWFPPLMHGLFLLIITLISWLVLKSKLGVLYKAIYLTVPTAVVLVTTGILLFRWPVVAYTVGCVLSLGAVYYLFRTKRPWLYSYSVILIALALAIFSISGGEI